MGTTIEDAITYHGLLQELQSPIVLVDEATEILESHLIVSLTNKCQQLILIGNDQKKPSASLTTKMGDYNLEVSLLDRMICNAQRFNILNVQYRMRHELFDLFVNVFYEIPIDCIKHESVCNLPSIAGVEKCLYFVDQDFISLNITNVHEQNTQAARFLTLFANYLVLNGYCPKDIVILVVKSRHLQTLLHEQSKIELLKHVLITTPDNFQGRESKIVLLSLVGYDKSENNNEIQVVLTSAKQGLYMLGNMENLCNNNMVWCKIKQALKARRSIGSSLPLCCQVHPEVITYVESTDNFKQIFQHGCRTPCGTQLVCGHKCTKLCHLIDQAHINTSCHEPCTKLVCSNNHKCTKLCYEECGMCQFKSIQVLQCGHEHLLPCSTDLTKYQCTVLVNCNLLCGHEVTNKPCYLDPKLVTCSTICNKIASCGHGCTQVCHIQSDPEHTKYKCNKPSFDISKDCSTKTHTCPKGCYGECPPCRLVVQKRRSICSHNLDVACSTHVDEVTCMKICNKVLPCKHRCRAWCSEQCGYCMVLVNKTLPLCGHVVKVKCSEEPSKIECKKPCTLKLQCGHRCKKKCNETCSKECLILVDHTKSVDCGHKFKIPCHLLDKDIPSNDHELLQFCLEPCNTKLRCGHICTGTCSKCVQGRIHQSCRKKCQLKLLVCGHTCSHLCYEPCLPCTTICSYKCEHQICKKPCGDWCIKCKKPCKRACVHRKCTAMCGDICNISPCNAPCPKKLTCSHSCVGFCGEPCPPFCSTCNRKELTEACFGSKITPNSRFVFLVDCEHVIENVAMENWLRETKNLLTFKSCLKCSAPIILTQRYNEFAKTTVRDIVLINKKYLNISNEMVKNRNALLIRIHALSRSLLQLIPDSLQIIQLLTKLKVSVDTIKMDKKKSQNNITLTLGDIKIRIAEDIIKIFQICKLKQAELNKKIASCFKFVLEFLLQEDLYVTGQVLSDITRELKRLKRIIQLGQLEDCDNFKSAIANDSSTTEIYKSINEFIFGAAVYNENNDITVYEKLLVLSKLVNIGLNNIPDNLLEISSPKDITMFQLTKCQNGHWYQSSFKCKECED